jgi:diacylglycerol kinase family enzyme
MKINFHRPKNHLTRAKLIFNPISGTPEESPGQLMTILTEMQALELAPEVHLIQPGKELQPVIEEALQREIRLFVVSGGDGTVDSVASMLAGTQAVLGIIPTGTQNNVALSLEIPTDIPAAVALLRKGHLARVDMGMAECAGVRRPFLEVCSVGLLSALFPAADDIQHGNLARIGDLLATLVNAPIANMHLVLDRKEEIHTQGHVVLVTNMPFLGPHYRVAGQDSYQNGLLEILIFANLTKLDLIGAVVGTAGSIPEDPRIHRYRVRQVEIETTPPMPVLVDGVMRGEGLLKINVQRGSLAVMTGRKLK